VTNATVFIAASHHKRPLKAKKARAMLSQHHPRPKIYPKKNGSCYLDENNLFFTAETLRSREILPFCFLFSASPRLCGEKNNRWQLSLTIRVLQQN
jgi:hypothetical protein